MWLWNGHSSGVTNIVCTMLISVAVAFPSAVDLLRPPAKALSKRAYVAAGCDVLAKEDSAF